MCDCGEKAYNTAALRGFGDEAYNSAALRGFGDEAYNSAALRGFGDEAYNSAALKGFGDEAYNSAALRGFGCGSRMKGGFVLPSLATIGTIIAAMKGAKMAYDGIKWAAKTLKGSGCNPRMKGGFVPAIPTLIKWAKKMKGGRALLLSPEKRAQYIREELANMKGRKKAAMMPYTIPVAKKHFAKRKARLSERVRKYLEDNDLLEEALFDTKTMKRFIEQANKALRVPMDESDIVFPEGYTPKRSIPERSSSPEPPTPESFASDLPTLEPLTRKARAKKNTSTGTSNRKTKVTKGRSSIPPAPGVKF